MFFYCPSEAQGKKLIEKYPHIPWLKCLEGWNGEGEIFCFGNIDAIGEAIEEVVTECRLK